MTALRVALLLLAIDVGPLGATLFSGTLAAGVTVVGAVAGVGAVVGIGVGFTGAGGALQPLSKAKATVPMVSKLCDEDF